jgi:hypothetical protein
LVQLNGELARVTSELTEIGHLKTSTTAEVREAEEQIKKLGPEIISKVYTLYIQYMCVCK